MRKYTMNQEIKTPFDVFVANPTKRISSAKVILDIVKAGQTTDGSPDFSPEMKAEFGNFINVLCESEFIRKADVPDNAFPYRLTWKGLCFLDTLNVLAQMTENFTRATNSPQEFSAQLAAFSFH